MGKTGVFYSELGENTDNIKLEFWYEEIGCRNYAVELLKSTKLPKPVIV